LAVAAMAKQMRTMAATMSRRMVLL
jgi:hypothetical protein